MHSPPVGIYMQRQGARLYGPQKMVIFAHPLFVHAKKALLLPCRTMHLQQGFPTPRPRPTTGLRPIWNWTAQATGRWVCMHSSTCASGMQASSSTCVSSGCSHSSTCVSGRHSCSCTKLHLCSSLHKWSCTHMCFPLSWNHALSPTLCQAAKIGDHRSYRTIYHILYLNYLAVIFVLIPLCGLDPEFNYAQSHLKLIGKLVIQN